MAAHIEGPLNWEQLGKRGTPIVFIHPNPMDLSCWIYQMAHLSTWFRCIGVDLPGYGFSPTATLGLSMTDVAQACWEAADEAATDPAIVVGLSVGSNVVMHMANQRPEQTLAVVMSGASYRPVKEFAFNRIKTYSELGVSFRREHALLDYSPEFRETPYGQYFADLFAERNPWADAATIVEQFRALSVPDPDWLFEGIGCPTLIISGSLDNGYQPSFELQRRINGCEHVTMEGAGHACNMERPWEWDRHFLEFLAQKGLWANPAAAGAASRS